MIKHNVGVRDFFKNDYPKLYLLSGSQVPTEINLDNTSRMGYYWNILALTWITINKLEDTPQHPYKTIIIERFVKRRRMIDVMKIINYSYLPTKRANEALKSFAETFRQEQIKNKVFPLVEFD